MNVFNSNDYERACIWYERIKYCVEKFNIKIEILREKLAVDLLNNKSVNYFHTDYQSIIDNFETEVYHIIETYKVEQRYLPFLCTFFMGKFMRDRSCNRFHASSE